MHLTGTSAVRSAPAWSGCRPLGRRRGLQLGECGMVVIFLGLVAGRLLAEEIVTGHRPEARYAVVALR